MRTAVPFAVLALVALLAPFLGSTAGALTISATVTGPTALAPSQVARYNVTVLGIAPGTEANYTVVYSISGTNTTGGSPAGNAPGRTTSATSPIGINVTAPVTEQALLLSVQVTAKVGTQNLNATAELTITVVRPITLTAVFHNAAATAAVNVTVRFYVDGASVGSTVVKRIGALSDGTATFAYLPVGLAPGAHTVRAEADLNGDGVIESSQGEVVTTTVFYDSVPAQSLGWSLLLGMGIAVIAFLGVVIARRRWAER